MWRSKEIKTIDFETVTEMHLKFYREVNLMVRRFRFMAQYIELEK